MLVIYVFIGLQWLMTGICDGMLEIPQFPVAITFFVFFSFPMIIVNLDHGYSEPDFGGGQ